MSEENMNTFETPESEALRNDVVWQCLGSYLSPGDLKDCRLVSKNFDKNVKGLKKWKGRMQLNLTKCGDVWGPPGFSIVANVHVEAVKVTLSVGDKKGSEEEAAEDAENGAQDALDASKEAREASEGDQQAVEKALVEAAEMAQDATQGAREAIKVAQQAPRGSQEAAELAKMAAVLAQEASQRAQATNEMAKCAVQKVQETLQKFQKTALFAQAAVYMAQDAARLAQRSAQEAQDAAEEQTNKDDAQGWPKVFKNVKSLTVEFDQRGIGAFDEDDSKSVGKTLAFVLGHYCTSTLETLIIDGNTLAVVDFSAILDSSNANFLERVRGLKKLEVRYDKVEHMFFRNYNLKSYIASNLVRMHNSIQNLGDEMAALKDLTIPEMQKIFKKNSRYNSSAIVNFIQSFGQNLLIPRLNVLKKLEIKEMDAVSEENFSVLVFPHLTHLSLRVSSEGGTKLCEFLGKQPNLQELVLKIQGHLSKNLLTVIKTKGANLVALKLKCWDMDENENWDFLASLKKLREFSFTLSSNFEFQQADLKIIGYVEDIFSEMPKGLRKISIRSGYLNILTTRRRMLETLRSQAEKFKQLEELSLVFLPLEDADDDDFDDDNDSNDEFLQFIGTKTGEHDMFPFPKLRKLHVSNVTICDEEGELLGEKAFWAGLQDVSIRNVKYDVSERSVINKLSGTEIRRLCLSGTNSYFQMSKKGVQKILKNSKCLETLISNHPGIKKAHRLKIAEYKPNVEEVDSDSNVESDAELESDGSGDDDGDSDDNFDAMDEGSDDDIPDLDDVDNF